MSSWLLLVCCVWHSFAASNYLYYLLFISLFNYYVVAITSWWIKDYQKVMSRYSSNEYMWECLNSYHTCRRRPYHWLYDVRPTVASQPHSIGALCPYRYRIILLRDIRVWIPCLRVTPPAPRLASAGNRTPTHATCRSCVNSTSWPTRYMKYRGFVVAAMCTVHDNRMTQRHATTVSLAQLLHILTVPRTARRINSFFWKRCPSETETSR